MFKALFTLLQRKKKINLAVNFCDDDDDEGNTAAMDALTVRAIMNYVQ